MSMRKDIAYSGRRLRLYEQKPTSSAESIRKRLTWHV
jgi:hypothetical protein